jgi:peptidoglycan/LPS O-acetylase OafA/YrhL
VNHIDLAGFAFFDAVLGTLAILFLTGWLREFFSPKAETQKERIPYFDFLKGVCIVLVIMMHTKDIAAMPPILGAPLWLAVPTFIFVSGYLTSKRNPENVGKDYFWKIWWRIGLVYVIFTIFWMFLLNLPLNELPLFLILGRANFGSLYFIPILLSLYAIYPLLLEAQKKIGWTPFLVLCFCFSTIFEYVDLQYSAVGWDANPVSLAFFGRLLFVFAAGMYFSKIETEKVRGLTLALIALLASVASIVFVVEPALHFISLFFGPVAFACLISILYRHISDAWCAVTRVFEELGKNSLVIYMAHPAILYFVPQLDISAYTGAEYSFIAIVILATVLSYAISLLFMKVYTAVVQSAIATQSASG